MTPVRVQRKRAKGWRMPDNTVYVGRGSKWGNPYVVGARCWVFKPCSDFAEPFPVYLYADTEYIADRQCAVDYFTQLFTVSGDDFLGAMPKYPADKKTIRDALAGKNLACWCPLDQPCHADVLLEIANGEAK